MFSNRNALATTITAALLVSLAKSQRTVGAWLPIEPNNYPAITTQLQNVSGWGGVLDVVQLSGCGWKVDNITSAMTINQSLFNSSHCQGILNTLQTQNIAIHMWVGNVPNQGANNNDPTTLISTTLALLKQYPYVKGIHFDDEKECAPRATLSNFTSWIHYLNTYSDALHNKADVHVSVAVQAMFGIEDQPYVHNAPCAKAPWLYSKTPEVVDLMSTMTVDRFLEMDTYYFTMARYLNALDWYVDNVPVNKLGVAVANLDVNPSLKDKPDEYLARMYALETSDVNWFNLFDMPIDVEWLEHAKRWKTKCAGCPKLACYDLSVKCDNNNATADAKMVRSP